MAKLFGKSKKTISEHIRNILSEGELYDRVVVRNFRTTTQHGAMSDKTQSRDVQFYNLGVIIAVAYRVKSHQGTQVSYLGNTTAHRVYQERFSAGR